VEPALTNRSKDDLILSRWLSDAEVRCAPNSGKLAVFLAEFEAYVHGHQTEAQLDRWLLSLQRLNHPILPRKRAEMHASYVDWRENRSGPRFFKEPNLHIFYPELLGQFQEMKAIYVLRDGRYMAHSKNLNQLERWGEYFGISKNRSPEDALFRLWELSGRRMNHLAGKFGSERLLLLRLEELIEDPSALASRISTWLNLNDLIIGTPSFHKSEHIPRSKPHPGKPEWNSALLEFGYSGSD